MAQRTGPEGVLPRVSALLKQVPTSNAGAADEAAIDAASADHALRTAITRLGDRLINSPANDTEPARDAALLAELHQLRWELRTAVAANRTRRMEVLTTGIRELRRVRDLDAIRERLPDAVLTFGGFDRVLVSRVEDTLWRPWRSLSRRRVVDAEESFVQWLLRGPALRLDRTSHEAQAVTRRGPILVSPATGAAGMAPSFLHARPQRLRSYAVAPLTLLDDVVGLIHVDYVDREIDSVDLDVLGEFTQAYDHLHERAFLLDRLHRQRAQVRSALNGVAEAFEQEEAIGLTLRPRGHPTDVASSPARRPERNQAPDELARLLTARELEVLRLLSTGATNDRIAELLVISTDTVKSHVKNILRKLGADNRSEAIVHYLRLSMGD